MMQAIVYGRVVGIKLVVVAIKNARNVLGIVVLIRVLLRAIAIGRIRDTHAETAMLKATQVLAVTSLEEEHWGRRVVERACGAWKGCFGFWICVWTFE
jgi:hypothetical protein